MSELVKVDVSVGTLEDLAARINAEHRACEAAAATAVEHAIRCGELLLEAKRGTKHGGWMRWVEDNFEGSHDLANKYMKVAQNSERVLNLPEKPPATLRGALDEIKRQEGKERRRQVEERNQRAREQHKETARQYAIQEAGGEVSMALYMEASHSYDFERPGEPVRFAPCERIWHTGYLRHNVDWDDEIDYYFEDEVPVLQPTETDFIAAIHRRGPTFHRYFNPDLGVQKPTVRPLSWDGNRLLLPTGHWEAAHYRGEMRRWWVWDVLGDAGREIRKAADRNQYKAGWLQMESLIGGLGNGAWKWLSSKELEAALVKDLEAVRERRSTSKADLSDPEVVYRLGESEGLARDRTERGRRWRRFAAFVESGALLAEGAA